LSGFFSRNSEILIEAVDIEFEILTEDNDSDGADNFFARL
jgi:hypothetical protein